MKRGLTWASFTLILDLIAAGVFLLRRARSVRVLAAAAALKDLLQPLIIDMGELVEGPLLFSVQVLGELLPELHPHVDGTIPQNQSKNSAPTPFESNDRTNQQTCRLQQNQTRDER